MYEFNGLQTCTLYNSRTLILLLIFTCDTTDRTPNTAINVATSSAVKCITWYRKDERIFSEIPIRTSNVDHWVCMKKSLEVVGKVCQQSNESQWLTCLRYINIQEYWPASGRYDKNTVIHIRRTIGSWPTFRKDWKTNTNKILQHL